MGGCCLLMEQAANPLTEILDDRGMNGRQLAVAANITEATVSQLRRGLRPGAQVRERVVKALDLTAAELAALGWTKEAVNG